MFRLIGDMCRFLAKVILLRRLISARTSQGISLGTQMLYLIVCLARYIHLFTTFYSLYNSGMKIVYISFQLSIIYYIRKYDQGDLQEQDTFPYMKCIVMPCSILAILTHVIVTGVDLDDLFTNVQELLWMFSIYLEALTILPQLSLLKKYRIVENLTANYVFLIGFYRFMYIINWVFRAHYEPFYRHHYGVYAAGTVHVLLHIEFFYYWAISKVNKKPLSYGEEGDIEYFDCSADELRNDENATSLLDTGVRRRRDGSNDDNNDDGDNDDESILLV